VEINYTRLSVDSDLTEMALEHAVDVLTQEVNEAKEVYYGYGLTLHCSLIGYHPAGIVAFANYHVVQLVAHKHMPWDEWYVSWVSPKGVTYSVGSPGA